MSTSKPVILHPREVEDSPFPGEAIPVPSESIGGQQVFSPTETPDQPFPKRVIASELISSSIDSMSKKILGEYKFTSMGAIKIGQIKISDKGILGENLAGETTFALDPDTGDATFKGTILAGTVIAGAVLADYIQVGGAAGDVNAGATTISGSQLTTGTVTADYVVASISISSPTISGGSIAIGSSNSIFKADSNGIYLGNAVFASAPFNVSMAGAVNATNITITGGTITSTQFITSASGSRLKIASDIYLTNDGLVWTDISGNDALYVWYNATTEILNIEGGDFWVSGIIYSDFGVSTDGNIDLNGNDLLDVGQISGFTATGTINMNQQAITNCYTIGGNNGTLSFKDTGRLQVDNHFDPSDGGSYNLGGASRYWGDISYKTLTDRGCLGWFDEGVELQDGRKVSDTEALLAIQKHSTLKTIYGTPRLDYTTLPKVVYKKASKHDGTLFERDKNNEPLSYEENGKIYQPQDGAETTALLSIMLGAIKELTNRVIRLEKK